MSTEAMKLFCQLQLLLPSVPLVRALGIGMIGSKAVEALGTKSWRLNQLLEPQ